MIPMDTAAFSKQATLQMPKTKQEWLPASKQFSKQDGTHAQLYILLRVTKPHSIKFQRIAMAITNTGHCCRRLATCENHELAHWQQCGKRWAVIPVSCISKTQK